MIDYTQREPYLTGMFNYLRETIIFGTEQLDVAGYDLFEYYYNATLKNERDVYNDHELLPKYYPSFLIAIDNFENGTVCEQANELNSDFSIYGCQTDLQGLANIGIRQSMAVCSMQWYKSYYSFLSEANTTDPVTIMNYLNDPTLFDTCKLLTLIKVDDLKDMDLAVIFAETIALFKSQSMDFFDQNMTLQNGLFAGYIISALLIFFFLTQLIILGLNNDIWKAKRLLALYPAHQISENIEFFKKIVQTLT